MTTKIDGSEYEQLWDNEWFDYKPPVKIACCDCGLVHEVMVRRKNNKLQLRLVRNNRSTAVLRRHHQHPCVPSDDE